MILETVRSIKLKVFNYNIKIIPAVQHRRLHSVVKFIFKGMCIVL